MKKKRNFEKLSFVLIVILCRYSVIPTAQYLQTLLFAFNFLIETNSNDSYLIKIMTAKLLFLYIFFIRYNLSTKLAIIIK